MSEEKGTGAITGITNFLFLAFILPGVIYLCFFFLFFSYSDVQNSFPGLADSEFDLQIALGGIVFLGLILSSFAFVLEMCFRWLLTRRWLSKKLKREEPAFASFSEVIFNADREKELGWYFWQLWGQAIMHWNIAWGVLLIFVVHKYVSNQYWPWSSWLSSWKDYFLLLVIVANLICHSMFKRWHNALISKLMGKRPTH